MKIYFERLGPKLPRYYMQIMLIVILLFSMTISAAAAEDMWEAADRIIKDGLHKNCRHQHCTGRIDVGGRRCRSQSVQ